MLRLFLTNSKASPEFVYKEYVPYFDWVTSKSHTPCWIGTKFPELFTSKNLIPLDYVKASKKNLSALTGVSIKNIESVLLQNQCISPSEKLFKQFDIEPKENLVIQKGSGLLKYLDKLKQAKKIVTWDEIFVHFAWVHNIPCLAFYDKWNPNAFRSPMLKFFTVSVDGKTKLIDDFLEV